MDTKAGISNTASALIDHLNQAIAASGSEEIEGLSAIAAGMSLVRRMTCGISMLFTTKKRKNA